AAPTTLPTPGAAPGSLSPRAGGADLLGVLVHEGDRVLEADLRGGRGHRDHAVLGALVADDRGTGAVQPAAARAGRGVVRRDLLDERVVVGGEHGGVDADEDALLVVGVHVGRSAALHQRELADLLRRVGDGLRGDHGVLRSGTVGRVLGLLGRLLLGLVGRLLGVLGRLLGLLVGRRRGGVRRRSVLAPSPAGRQRERRQSEGGQ